MTEKKLKTLRLVLGDQLNINHSWFSSVDESVTYVLMEVRSETDYAQHHIQKVLGFFASMRQFSQELEDIGHRVLYFKINDSNNQYGFSENCKSIIDEFNIEKFEYQLPDEYRVDQSLKTFTASLSIPYEAFDSEHFFSTRNEMAELFKGKSNYLMETFYRYMRKKHKVLLVDGDKPYNGKWNFDADNRQKLPKNHKPIGPLVFVHDLTALHQEILDAKIKTIGRVDPKHYLWSISRKESLTLLDYFLENCLHLFGTFQDAMSPNEWSIYHSRLSFSMNLKMLAPQEVVSKAVEKYFASEGKIEYHQVEGFVRQIIGWREYMRGIYWMKMPEYASLNYFGHERDLPEWYWTGKTKMNCMKDAIHQSLDFAYAHHIQRLMVTGNFALLAGIDPDQVDAWYLGIYIDAIEWVEITNTRGMSQFADGGIVGTKPYVSSAAYINKMSSYCNGCHYDKNIKTGERACPFNSLYWNFYKVNEDKLSKNPRIGMMYNVWYKMQADVQRDLLAQAEYYLEHINEL
jgi:deoxyribodipyrimidine photolyase-related protein